MSGQGGVSTRVLTVPNLLTMLRLVLVPVFFALILTAQDGWALLVLAVSGFSDYLDGALARRWGQVSRLGQLMDPAADRLYILSTLLGLAFRDIVPWWLVVVLVGRDVVLALTVPVLGRRGYGPLQVHVVGKAATFNLLYAFPLLLLGEGGSVLATLARSAGWAFAWWGTAMYWWAALLYLGQAWLLLRRRPEQAGVAAEAGGGR